MPGTNVSHEFELTTRDRYTKVETVLSITVNGKELPNMAVIGGTLDELVQILQERITESYKVVPERTDTPMASPVR